jgi:RNA polymerase sigma-70 factor, ECF subfamily
VEAAVSGGDVTWPAPRALEGAPDHSRRRDRALVRAAQRGDAEALERLFRAHWGMAHRAAYLVVHDAAAAEDIAQEAFLAAVRALDRFDRRRPFGPWLHRIVVNRAIDHARARGLRREVELEDRPADSEEPADLDGIVAALAALPPDQRAAIVLRHLLGYTPGEIAGLLGLPRGTVNSRLRRGLDAMRERLEGEA